MSDNKSFSDSGILNYDKAYHFIKKIISSVIKEEAISTVPHGKVESENSPADNQTSVSIRNTQEGSMKGMKPASFHFLSVPVVSEYVPIYNYKDEQFFGNSMPIYDSLHNNAKVLPKNTTEFRPDFGKNPIQVTPGDVVVQGRYGHSLMFSDMKGQATFRIGNSMRSRDDKDIDVFNSETPNLEKAIKSDGSYPIFYNPNIDGSSFYMLKRTPPGVDLESELILAKKKHYRTYKENVLFQTFRDNHPGAEEKLFMSSDSLLFYTKGLNDNKGHDISMLSSGNVFINSFRNVFITTPEVVYPFENKEIPEGRISLGSQRDPGDTPNSKVQPVVRGLNYKETIEDVLELLEFVVENFKNLSEGGMAVDKDGSSITGEAQAPVIKILNDKIKSVKNKLDEDLSKKVFTT
tara:strand:+ start:1508 stop:2725 length:1218 start_codon:yes stop_codon:yes gene_type:complete